MSDIETQDGSDPSDTSDVADSAIATERHEQERIVAERNARHVELAQLVRAGADARDQMAQAKRDGIRLPVGDRRKLNAAMRSGHDARNALIEENLGLVRMLARRRAVSTNEFDDLMQAGVLAQLAVTERFDPEAGFAYSTFVAPSIRRAISREIRSGLVGPDRSSALRRRLGDGDDATLTGADRRVWLAMHPTSLDSPTPGTDGLTVGANVPSGTDDYADADRRIDAETLKRQLIGAIDRLPTFQREAIRLKYRLGEASGDFDIDPRTNAEVAELIGRSESAAYERLKLGMRSLRRRFGVQDNWIDALVGGDSATTAPDA